MVVFRTHNVVTPIVTPDAMDRTELLDRTMYNYRRFRMRKAFSSYPWQRDPLRRRYLRGCLEASLGVGFKPQGYDRGRGRGRYSGRQSKTKGDFRFSRARTLDRARVGDWKALAERRLEKRLCTERTPRRVTACGGSPEQLPEVAETNPPVPYPSGPTESTRTPPSRFSPRSERGQGRRRSQS